jgi:hypothetical protein
MTGATNQTLTWITSSSQDPVLKGVKGTHLATIRTHTTILQHRRRKSLLQRMQEANASIRAYQSSFLDQGYNSSQGNLLDREARAANEEKYNPVRPKCRHCIYRKSLLRQRVPALLDRTPIYDANCGQCRFDLVRTAMLGFGCKGDSLRNEPFDALPIPTNPEIYLSIDYCN